MDGISGIKLPPGVAGDAPHRLDNKNLWNDVGNVGRQERLLALKTAALRARAVQNHERRRPPGPATNIPIHSKAGGRDPTE